LASIETRSFRLQLERANFFIASCKFKFDFANEP